MVPSDARLLQIVDLALVDAARRSGDWLVCRPGCTQCCTGVFSISQLDAVRLQEGFEELARIDAERASSVRARAESSVARLSSGFPGDPATGILDTSETGEALFEDFANDEICPALNPATGLCEVYAFRPLACRTFGPPLETPDGVGVCELCYHGATPQQISDCALGLDPASLEAPVLEEFEQSSPLRGETLVAFALTRKDS